MLHFCLNLIIFSHAIAHGLDACGMHLVHCPFGGQWIATHDAIQHVMYAFVRKSGMLYGESGGTPLH
jgi:hypothetical protein